MLPCGIATLMREFFRKLSSAEELVVSGLEWGSGELWGRQVPIATGIFGDGQIRCGSSCKRLATQSHHVVLDGSLILALKGRGVCRQTMRTTKWIRKWMTYDKGGLRGRDSPA